MPFAPLALDEQVVLERQVADASGQPFALLSVAAAFESRLQFVYLPQKARLFGQHARALHDGVARAQLFRRREVRVEVDGAALAFEVVELARLHRLSNLLLHELVEQNFHTPSRPTLNPARLPKPAAEYESADDRERRERNRDGEEDSLRPHLEDEGQRVRQRNLPEPEDEEVDDGG